MRKQPQLKYNIVKHDFGPSPSPCYYTPTVHRAGVRSRRSGFDSDLTRWKEKDRDREIRPWTAKSSDLLLAKVSLNLTCLPETIHFLREEGLYYLSRISLPELKFLTHPTKLSLYLGTVPSFLAHQRRRVQNKQWSSASFHLRQSSITDRGAYYTYFLASLHSFFDPTPACFA